MNIETKNIDDRINGLKAEMSSLEAGHTLAVKRNQEENQKFQQESELRRNRYLQLQGAVQILEELKKGQNEPDNNGSDGRRTEGVTDPVPGSTGGARHHRRTGVGNRKLDKPVASPGKAGAGNNPGAPGGNLGA